MTDRGAARRGQMRGSLEQSSARAERRTALRSMPDAVVSQDRQRLDHDVLHELSTIVLLASLLHDSPALNSEDRLRAGMLVNETKWLRTLVQAYCSDSGESLDGTRNRPQLVRLDWMLSRLVTSTRTHVSTRISIDALPAMVYANGIELGRAVRNILWNALEAAGPTGHVAVRISTSADTALIEFEDDGPGFGAVASSGRSLGLDIVREAAQLCGGRMEITAGDLGGCAVRLILSAVPAN